ncbi:MAG: nucleotidyltransferase domain-containing protein [Crocinitomicaceae bacterium]
MTVEELQNSGQLLFECISGSRAYGLHTPSSDIDIKGVFVLPESEYFGLNYISQINDERNDVVYYELQKFVELCLNNNPNMLELLNMPEDCVRYKHPLFDRFTMELFLSKKCEKSFANYAYSQIKKARGLEKKILNPVDKERKSVLDFCYVYSEGKSIELTSFLEKNKIDQSNCGLSRLPHMRDCYSLYHNPSIPYKGIIKKEDSNDIALSTIPKGEKALGLLFFNKDGYSIYCKKYREYWDWVEKRNEDRYKNTVDHGKNYDAKNMMHTFRLLHMAEEIAKEGKVYVRRADRALLLDIKQGNFEYKELVETAEAKKQQLTEWYTSSDLPDEPNKNKIEQIMVEVRQAFYQSKH